MHCTRLTSSSRNLEVIAIILAAYTAREVNKVISVVRLVLHPSRMLLRLVWATEQVHRSILRFLYQRMFSQMNGANMGMNPMMGGMNPMMGMGAGMGGGMGMGTGMGMGGGAGYMNPMAGMRGGMGMGMAGGGPGMGRGGAAGPGMGMGMGGAGATGGAGGAGAGAGAIGGNIPRGPRGQGPMGGGGPGPQRSNRGGSHFHPYARG
ncbi:hypothetical protein SISNIDRAFT_172896 [Sistotremastrum niveocremeum HHB9708]|uniref:Uncharacterized protein n=1 Tax=Sistotremastrum niveocremeum HHB9708 TaxID=1314777 RepID=A0A164RV33_9AGAM|nr:hypothetical protein SISNIDRAFT_172896 [Sistotremastrum niveocremeum HHB9708]